MQNVTRAETEYVQADSLEAQGLVSFQQSVSTTSLPCCSFSFSVWAQGRGEWANMMLNARRRSQHESRAFLCTERTDCVAGSWNARRSLSGAVLAGIILLDCSRSGRGTRAEGKAPSLYFCRPVIFLLFSV